MIKVSVVLLLVYLCFVFEGSAQWTHLSGTDDPRFAADFTTPFIGGLYESAMVIDSTNSILYVFGGKGFDGINEGIVLMFWFNRVGDFNYIWKYHIVTNTWEYLGGNETTDPLADYSASSAHPGGVSRHTMVIDSTDSYLYVFGGRGKSNVSRSGRLNDMWKYNIATNTWEHLSGSMIPDPNPDYISSSPYPGGMNDHTMVIDSTDSYLYIFGGESFNISRNGIELMFWFNRVGGFNDIWKYHIATNTWEFLSGSKTLNTFADYNSSFPSPGGVSNHDMVIDHTDSYLYVFGGSGLDDDVSDPSPSIVLMY